MLTRRYFRTLTTLTLAAAIALPVSAALPAGDAYAAASKYPIVSQPFKIEGASANIGVINKGGTTYVALRSLNTALGLKTSYHAATKTVQVSGRGRTMTFSLSGGAAYLNGQLITGPSPILQNDTTYLPLRFLLERFGYVVSYNNGSKVIGLQAIAENALTVKAETIGADGFDKSLLVFYPVVSGYQDAAVQKKINDFLKKEADRYITAGVKDMDRVAEANDELLADDPNAEIRRPTFDGRYTVTYNEKGLLSLYADYHIYLGGAHGNTIRAAYTFDLKTGDTLTLKEAAGSADYVSIINQHVKKQIADRELFVNPTFETIEPDRSFFLNRGGIVVYFTEYEYTSYADGMPQFVIPYSAFKGR